MRERRGVSTYIAAIFILFIFAAFMISMLMIIRGWSSLISDMIDRQQLAAERVKELLRVDNVSISNGDIIIGVRNTGSVDIQVIKYYVRNLVTNAVKFGNLNVYIAVGESRYITIPGSFKLSENYLIALITSRSNIIKATYPYTPPTPPTPSVNITYSITYAPVIFSNYTVASLGFNSTESQPTPASDTIPLAGNEISSNPLTISSTYTSVYEFPSFKDWQYYKVINIRERTGTDLTDYTVKIVLNSSNFNFSRANYNGTDIRFVWSDKVTLLNYWIERWDSAAQEAIIWVKVPKLAGGQNTTIYMLYGNSNATYDPQHHGLTKVMEPLPARDGPNYRIQYEIWNITEEGSKFDPSQGNPINLKDDNNTTSIDLPFTFPYYNSSYSQVYVCTNGFIGIDYSGTDPQSSESGLMSIRIIAPFWADLTTEKGDVYINTSYQEKIDNISVKGIYVRWEAQFVSIAGQKSSSQKKSTANFAVMLYENGLIRFDYGTIDVGTLPGRGWRYSDNTPIVGVSLGDSTHYTIVYGDGTEANSLSNMNSIMLWPRKVATAEPAVALIPSDTSDYRNERRTYLVSALAYWFGVGPAAVVELDLTLNISSATPSTYELEVYENSTGVWRFLNSCTLASGTLTTISVPVNKYYPSGTIGFMLNITGEVPFNATFNYAALTYRVLGDPLLAVVTNGSNKLYLYDLVTEKWFSVTLPSGSFINPSVAFDYANMNFRILDGTHIITYDPYYNRSSVDLPLSKVARESAFILYLNGYLLYAPGGGSSVAYAYDLSSGISFPAQLPEGVAPYTCVAYDPNDKVGYVLFGGTGDIYSLTIDASGTLIYDKIGRSPSAQPVGLAYGGGLLWVICRGGGIHKIDPSTGAVEPLNIQPPYYPFSEGDRLAYVDIAGTAYLYHIRGDGTSEVWVIRVS